MRETLVVDLDGTLLKSDMLYETFWSAVGLDCRATFRAAVALTNGKTCLKQYLAKLARVDIDTLPYDSEVISYIEAWRKEGGRTALVTASDEKIAQRIGAHIGLFDEVHGSSENENLKGAKKADFLVQRYGEKKFSYMGDSKADLEVWKHAKRAVAVNVSESLAKEARNLVEEFECLATNKPHISFYFKAIRPHQWLKNLLVFLPMLAAHQLDLSSFLLSLLAFVSFSLAASGVYVLNDLLDLNADRAHPRKRTRPFASGTIPIWSGTWMAVGLLAISSGLAVLIGYEFLIVMIGYLALTTGYSLHLKRLIILDICVLAGLYTIRIIAGGAATGITLSVWLLAFSIFFFLSLAAVKRQIELVDNTKQQKLTVYGRGYHVDDLPIISMISISAGYVAVLVMALYVNSPDVIELYAHPVALWGVCAILLFWLTNTAMLAHRGELHDDPVIYAVKNRQSQICFLLILVFVLIGAVP